MVEWTLTTGPTQEVVSLAECKLHCRVNHDDEDEYLDRLRVAARALIEQSIGRGVFTQTWTMVAEDWSTRWWLPMAAPLQSITSVQYYATDGTLTVLNSTFYVTDTTSEPAQLQRAPNKVWPALQSDRLGRIIVTYVVGWTSAAAVPVPIKQALLLLVGHWYQNREAVTVSIGGTATVLPFGVDALLGPYRVWWRPPCQV